MTTEGSPTLLHTLRWAWWSHRRVPYRFSEIWTKGGREEHFRRWNEARAEEVRRALLGRGLRFPETWSSEDLRELREVVVNRAYDVEGFKPSPNGVVVDAGCGFGDFTLLSATSHARVFAFDPDPENVRHTKELLEVNGLEANLNPVALGDHLGTIRLGKRGPAMLSVSSSREAREVPVWTLDSLKLPRVTLLKIDVEGMEAEVLTGSKSLLRRDRPKVAVEVHGEKPAREVRRILREVDYSLAHSSRSSWSRDYVFVRNEFWTPSELLSVPRSLRQGEPS